MMIHTRISCHPAPGQSTIVPYEQDNVQFAVVLETNEDSAPTDWSVDLWHNGYDGEAWSALSLQPLNSEQDDILILRRESGSLLKQFVYTGSLTRPTRNSTACEFTVRYRRSGRDWTWINANNSTSNGELIFQKSSLPDTLSDSFSKFTTTAQVKAIRSEVPKTKLWSLEFETPPAGTMSTIHEILLGVPLYVSRWWALVRQWAAWLQPAHGHGVFKVQEDTMVCSFQCRDGFHLTLLGVSGVEDMQIVFRDDGFGGVIIRARNERREPTQARILAAIGYDHETTLAACMYAARNLVQRGSYVSSTDHSMITKAEDDLRANWYASWTDGIGYCTWNGIGQHLTQNKICDALRILRENNVKIQTLIIDDNWQTLDQSDNDHHYHTWSDFEANRKGFPDGLGKTISAIREQNPSIKHIAVWHAMFGYWGGITPDGPIAQRYSTKQIQRMETGRKGFEATKMTVVSDQEISSLYSDFYAFLSRCQVDGVKTDVQMMLDLVTDPQDRRTIIRSYQDAWNLNGLVNFSDRMISCMSHAPGILFHSLLPTNRPAITLRNSDDFWPEIPDSHPWHIFVNAHNSLFTQHLNVIPDWDMFQTTHEFASFHAAARCISGGPIYITDKPGKHNVNLINQMTAETVQGTTVILRPNCVARAVPSSVYIGNNEPRLLKVGSYHGRTDRGTGLLGVFNCTKSRLQDLVQLKDFRGVRGDQKYVVRSYSTGKISKPITLSSQVPIVSLDLDVRGWEILTSFPLSTSTRGDKTLDIVPLGLIDKMSGAAAVLEYKIKPDEGQRLYLSVTLKALGVLGVYISKLKERTISDDFLIMIWENVIPSETVSAEGNVLMIDVGAAWNAIDEQPPWNNEVTLDIYIAW